MNTIKSIIARWIVPEPLPRGEELWKQLRKNSGPLIGSWSDDAPSVEKFVKMAKKLPFWDLDALKQWIKFAYDELERKMPEHTRPTVENHYCKWRQIYRQHIEALGE
ncbi:MAG: hypothetical protein Q4D11_00685 [Rhodospirillales bacterium]|nr:hypothetical protein [Rhodospirillales bacterium]